MDRWADHAAVPLPASLARVPPTHSARFCSHSSTHFPLSLPPPRPPPVRVPPPTRRSLRLCSQPFSASVLTISFTPVRRESWHPHPPHKETRPPQTEVAPPTKRLVSTGAEMYILQGAGCDWLPSNQEATGVWTGVTPSRLRVRVTPVCGRATVGGRV